ncbi:MAG: outer membrane lipoprotein chaperone LolA [Gammaproteobacteria bacterium]|nr:outer membrane lipoprotein chaperone LolA [Gammaproteobacteria bacterium]
MKSFHFLCALCVLCGESVAAAEPAQDALQQFVDGVQNLSARFEQVQTDDKGEVIQKSSGTMRLARPGKFRWSYEKPYEQLMICDGRTIWLYDPDLAQVTVREAKDALAGTPAELLSKGGAIGGQFRIEDAGVADGARVVRLIPKAADSDFKSIELWLRDGTPTRMRFADQLGGTSEVTFGDIRKNAGVDDKQFRFEVPKGVEIIQADSPAP